ncbi:MAG TPA: DUF58 domain-containing protein [Verrucomicrobiae bacterium]|jgi:uncharacterized protein (DUF58 family)|nr:DUF58 domain-containing protein [Verrucomicrobiae bacterium]
MFFTLMLLFYVASVTSQSGLLLLFIGLIGGCFIVNFSFGRRNVQNLKIASPKDVFLVEGGKASQPWRIENQSKKHLENIQIIHEDELLFRLPLVAVGDSVSLVPDLIYPRRGVFPNTQVTVASVAPYGLLRTTRQLVIEGEVTVYPKIYETTSPAGKGVDLISGGRFRGGRRVSSGTHFAGVRGWQTGDSFKQVHWKSTARRGELMVKDFEEELAGRVSLILDAVSDDEVQIDNAVRAAGSIGAATLQEGHQLEFTDLTNPERLRLPPFSDERELLERLARYTPVRGTAEPGIENLWRKSSIALVGTEFRPQWVNIIAQAHRQNRRIHIYLPPGKDIPAGTEAELWHFDQNAIWLFEEALAQ